MKKLLAALLATPAALAAANTNVVALANDAKDTFDAVLPISLTVMGVMIAIGWGYAALRPRRKSV